MSDEVKVLLLALGLEAVMGDPVSRWHPVAMFGRVVEAVVRRAPREGRLRPIAWGGLIVLTGVGGVALGSSLVLQALGSLSTGAGVLAGAVLLKTSFSYRQLEHEALGVAGRLEAHDLAGACTALRALVSRDTANLSVGLAVSAAVESLAENLGDSFVAPLLFFVIFGVPGALAYRAINTLDAMIGYHGVYEYLGRVAARVDDIANLVPSRLGCFLLVLGALTTGLDWRAAVRVAIRDHARTESPNAGWPMAAMAGAVGIALEKSGYYRLGDELIERTPVTIRAAVRVTRGAAAIGVLAAAVGVVR